MRKLSQRYRKAAIRNRLLAGSSSSLIATGRLAFTVMPEERRYRNLAALLVHVARQSGLRPPSSTDKEFESILGGQILIEAETQSQHELIAITESIRYPVSLAPQVGLEPTTLRLTAEQLVAASHCKHKT